MEVPHHRSSPAQLCEANSLSEDQNVLTVPNDGKREGLDSDGSGPRGTSEQTKETPIAVVERLKDDLLPPVCLTGTPLPPLPSREEMDHLEAHASLAVTDSQQSSRKTDKPTFLKPSSSKTWSTSEREEVVAVGEDGHTTDTSDHDDRRDNEQNRCIKRPLNRFFLYKVWAQPHYALAYPGLSNRVISKMISRDWNNQTGEIKEHFAQLAEWEKKKHNLRYPNYKYRPGRKIAKKWQNGKRPQKGKSSAGNRSSVEMMEHSGKTLYSGPGSSETSAAFANNSQSDRTSAGRDSGFRSTEIGVAEWNGFEHYSMQSVLQVQAARSAQIVASEARQSEPKRVPHQLLIESIYQSRCPRDEDGTSETSPNCPTATSRSRVKPRWWPGWYAATSRKRGSVGEMSTDGSTTPGTSLSGYEKDSDVSDVMVLPGEEAKTVEECDEEIVELQERLERLKRLKTRRANEKGTLNGGLQRRCSSASTSSLDSGISSGTGEAVGPSPRRRKKENLRAELIRDLGNIFGSPSGNSHGKSWRKPKPALPPWVGVGHLEPRSGHPSAFDAPELYSVEHHAWNAHGLPPTPGGGPGAGSPPSAHCYPEPFHSYPYSSSYEEDMRYPYPPYPSAMFPSPSLHCFTFDYCGTGPPFGGQLHGYPQQMDDAQAGTQVRSQSARSPAAGKPLALGTYTPFPESVVQHPPAPQSVPPPSETYFPPFPQHGSLRPPPASQLPGKAKSHSWYNARFAVEAERYPFASFYPGGMHPNWHNIRPPPTYYAMMQARDPYFQHLLGEESGRSQSTSQGPPPSASLGMAPFQPPPLSLQQYQRLSQQSQVAEEGSTDSGKRTRDSLRQPLPDKVDASAKCCREPHGARRASAIADDETHASLEKQRLRSFQPPLEAYESMYKDWYQGYYPHGEMHHSQVLLPGPYPEHYHHYQGQRHGHHVHRHPFVRDRSLPAERITNTPSAAFPVDCGPPAAALRSEAGEFSRAISLLQKSITPADEDTNDRCLA